MAKKKRHINNIEELDSSLRITGGVLPHSIDDLNSCYKLLKGTNPELLEEQSSKYTFDEIWESTEFKTNPERTNVVHFINTEVEESWGMAARGSIELSDEVKNAIRENEESNDKEA